ncbi:hypothetical protein MPTK1_3g17120 [Marchantia polymorpha subsp. ruderalis]|uniref:Cilia- and flagella-associated protein 157 n=2 Tax=Marchantia polymorpha TaxID=3197 RepID=A0AAF6B1P7_MARPO|nr:hypothetical protein MARPO_0039s0082 [Marchantia polymorpha]BBN05931.1 hypothetical protein Mp_3g17120 [Marchantia polymorpha subsp. ruderalis]|eukprot:PTQ40593.1 hypothetical protein MARPO_0039s0082 [Marchantia polymorpha]
MANKDGKKGKQDDATMYRNLCIQKDMEVIVMEDKCRKLETRSMHVEEMIETLAKKTEEKIENLEKIVAYLNSEEAKKDEKIAKLEALVAKLETDMKETIERLNKELEDEKGRHEFQYNSLKLQLESANVKLREMHDFSLRKAAMEAELISLKEQLAKEQRDHAEAISDVERNAVQERERLKKEIERRVEETKKEMTRLMEEQLHQKTKRTITENEQLRKEVTYHTRQTDMMLQKNEKLTNENLDLHRSLILAKEMEDDLSFRNHMYQKTTRILVFKLREKEEEMRAAALAVRDEADTVREEEELKALLSVSAEPPKAASEESSASAKTGDEAMRFLYACLEDLELERLIDAKKEVDRSHATRSDSKDERFALSTAHPPASRPVSPPAPIEGVQRLDTLSVQQRQELLKKLIRAAASFRTVTDSMVEDALDYSKFSQAHPPKTVGKSNIRVDDILGMPVEALRLDGPARAYQWKKPTTAAVQADLTPHAIRTRSPTLF